jgi:hypothetical protein
MRTNETGTIEEGTLYVSKGHLYLDRLILLSGTRKLMQIKGTVAAGTDEIRTIGKGADCTGDVS